MPARVILADDHAVLRDGVKALIEPFGFGVVGMASDGHEVIELARDLRPELAVLDISMPGLNGIDAARGIARVSPATGVVLLTMRTEAPYVVAALRTGVRGYVHKSHTVTDLVQALRDVLAGGTYVSPPLHHAVLADQGRPEAPARTLSLRERQVLQLVSEGKSSKEIAHVLALGAPTVETYRTRMMRKLGIHDVAGLVRYAVREGLTEA